MIESTNIYESFGSKDKYMCRICLEEDDENNLIFPCKCKGSSKYVHKNCLNEWRTTSENTHNFSRCELCHYEYKIVNIENNDETSCSSDCRKIMRNTLPLYAFFAVISFMLGILIEYIDSSHLIIKNLPNKEEYSCQQCIHPIYYLIGASILLFIQICIVLTWFCQVKNKKLYCNIYLSRKNSIFVVIMASVAVAFLFDWMPALVILEMAAIKMFQAHFYSIDMLKKENALNIQNYEDDIEENREEEVETKIEMIEQNVSNDALV